MLGVVLDEQLELGTRLALFRDPAGRVGFACRQFQPGFGQFQRQYLGKIGRRVLALALQILQGQVRHALGPQSADKLQVPRLLGRQRPAQEGNRSQYHPHGRISHDVAALTRRGRFRRNASCGGKFQTA